MFSFLKRAEPAQTENHAANAGAAGEWLDAMHRMEQQIPEYRTQLGQRIAVHYGPIFTDAKKATEGEDAKTRSMVYLAQSRWLHGMADGRWMRPWGGYDAHALRFLGFFSFLEAHRTAEWNADDPISVAYARYADELKGYLDKP